MPAGRPTEYDYEKLKPLIEEYFEECTDYTEQELIGMSSKGTELYKNKQIVRIPTIEGLALKLGINKSTIYDWASQEDKKEFSNDIETLRAMQAERLLNKGLSGDYNPTIAKVLLTKHGYRDAVDTDLTTKGESVNTQLLVKFMNKNETNSNRDTD